MWADVLTFPRALERFVLYVQTVRPSVLASPYSAPIQPLSSPYSAAESTSYLLTPVHAPPPPPPLPSPTYHNRTCRTCVSPWRHPVRPLVTPYKCREALRTNSPGGAESKSKRWSSRFCRSVYVRR